MPHRGGLKNLLRESYGQERVVLIVVYCVRGECFLRNHFAFQGESRAMLTEDDSLLDMSGVQAEPAIFLGHSSGCIHGK